MSSSGLLPDAEFVAKVTELESAAAFSASCCHGPAPFHHSQRTETVLCLLRPCSASGSPTHPVAVL